MRTLRAVMASVVVSAACCAAAVPVEAAVAAPSAATVVSSAATVVSTVGRDWTGTYTKGSSSGTAKFTAVRAIGFGSMRGYIGNLVMGGTARLGGEYWSTRAPGQRFVYWNNTTTGATGMSATLTVVDATTESGPVTWYDARGNVTATGTLTIH